MNDVTNEAKSTNMFEEDPLPSLPLTLTDLKVESLVPDNCIGSPELCVEVVEGSFEGAEGVLRIFSNAVKPVANSNQIFSSCCFLISASLLIAFSLPPALISS